MDVNERQKLIEEYEQGYEKLITCLDGIPKEMWQFKPAPEEWSVHEIIVHMADSETDSALRARLLISEPGKSVMAYDQDLWPKSQNYHAQDWRLALDGIRWARLSTAPLIKKLPEEIWQHTVQHPEYDEPFDFYRWLKIYAGHITEHIEQIENNYKIWKEKH